MLNLTQKKTSTNEIKKPKLIETELGTERLCIHCGEYWPLDSEFWYSRKSKSKKNPEARCYESACKCCYLIRYKPHRAKLQKNLIRSNHERLAS